MNSTRTLCHVCGQVIDGRIVQEGNAIYLLKRCPEHGSFRELYEEDAAWQRLKPDFDKPGSASACQTSHDRGCPHDCGLCPDHDQHTCIGLIEVTRRCSLGCPTCFAHGGSGSDLSLEQIARMMDFHIAAEGGRAEILQISGGEPAEHPQILEIIRMARARNYGYVMLNTNGLRLASDPAFATALAEFRGGFEVYLQFDGLDDDIYRGLRGRPLLELKQQAVRRLRENHVPVTLVCTVKAGVNDQALGDLLFYAMQEPGVRGVNFQPLAYFGRLAGPGGETGGIPAQAERDRRVTLSGVLRRIEQQTSRMLLQSDFIPLPCNVERVAITYLLRQNGRLIPVTRGRDMRPYRNFFNNTFLFTFEETLSGFKDADGCFTPGACCELASDLKRMLPFRFLLQPKAEKIRFVDENTFRISVSSFIDPTNFDLKSMQKECVHVITPDLRRIPFSAFNMLHRGRYDGDYL